MSLLDYLFSKFRSNSLLDSPSCFATKTSKHSSVTLPFLSQKSYIYYLSFEHEISAHWPGNADGQSK